MNGKSLKTLLFFLVLITLVGCENDKVSLPSPTVGGQNFRIGRKELSFELKKPWVFMQNFNYLRAKISAKNSEKQQREIVRKGRDSNPRDPFEAYRLSRSAP